MVSTVVAKSEGEIDIEVLSTTIYAGQNIEEIDFHHSKRLVTVTRVILI